MLAIHRAIASTLVAICLIGGAKNASAECTGTFFPAPGDRLNAQDHKIPHEVGMKAEVIKELQRSIRGFEGCDIKDDARWALWRHGYLLHVQGSFTDPSELKSARKTIHALTIGALIQAKKIADDRTLGHHVKKTWNAQSTSTPEGDCDNDATLRHVLTQTTSYSNPKKCPGEVWHYSDLNPPVLNNIALRAYLGDNTRKFDETPEFYRDKVLRPVLFDKLGASKTLDAFPATWAGEGGVPPDGIRIKGSLSDLGRVGILMANDGKWKSQWLIPKWYALEMAKVQTTGSTPPSQYSLMTWTNAKQEIHPSKSPWWTTASGADGHYILWNRDNGVSMVILDSAEKDGKQRCIYPEEKRQGGGSIQITPVVDILEASITGPNPLAGKCAAAEDAVLKREAGKARR